MICNNSNNHHDINCKYHNNNNALKGASTAVNQQQQKQLLVFNQQEVNFLGKSLQICRQFVTNNQAQYQQNPKDILNEISTSINILSARRQNKQNQQSTNTNTKLKGASLDNINNNPFKSIDNIRKMCGLASNESASHLKGASNSNSTQNKNNIICSSKKEHLKDLLKQFNLI